MYDLERKDSSTNFSFFLETRKRGKRKTQQRAPLNYTGICDNGNGGNERTTRDGGRVKTETILSKRILRAQVSSAFATKRKMRAPRKPA